jgi:hypothetical protein
MKKILCLFTHKWSDWEYIGSSGRYDEKLRKECKRCGSFDIYIGPTDIDNRGRKIPSII